MFRLSLCWIPLCLTLLGACSTVRPVPPPVTTKIERPTPGDELLVLCEAPIHVKSTTVGAIVTNALEAQAAYDHCAARLCRLVEWFKPVQCDAKPAARTP